MNQTEGPVTLSEGALFTLNCTYQTTYSDSYHFWYVHHLNKAPQLLLKGSMTNQRPEHEGFQATLVNSDSSFHLQKWAVQASDSAVYYCALNDTVREGCGGAEHKPKGSRRLKAERGIFSPWSEFSLHLEFSGKPVKLRSNPRNPGGWKLLYRENRANVSLKEDPSSNPQKHPCSARKIPLFSRLTLKKIYFSHNVRWILDATELIIHLQKRNRWLKPASPES